MSCKLTPAQRKQIISDYKHGISNSEYRVLMTKSGTYQVRKRENKFMPYIQQQQQQQVEHEEEEEAPPPKKDARETGRMTNEELLHKLSSILQVPERRTGETPEEFDQEEEAYEQDQEFLERAQHTPSPWQRRRLRLF